MNEHYFVDHDALFAAIEATGIQPTIISHYSGRFLHMEVALQEGLDLTIRSDGKLEVRNGHFNTVRVRKLVTAVFQEVTRQEEAYWQARATKKDEEGSVVLSDIHKEEWESLAVGSPAMLIGYDRDGGQVQFRTIHGNWCGWVRETDLDSLNLVHQIWIGDKAAEVIGKKLTVTMPIGMDVRWVACPEVLT